MENITQFLTPENVGTLTQLLISGLFVMATVQCIKSPIDRFVKWASKGKIKKVKTSDITMIICIVQVIFVMFAVCGYELTAITVWLTAMNTVILYLGCTKGFDAVFKNITIKQEDKK